MLKNPLFSDCSSKKRMIEDRQCLENVLTDLLYRKSFFNGVTIRFMCDFQGTDFDLYFFYPSALFAPSFYSIFFCLPLPESFSGYPNACGLTPDVPAGVFFQGRHAALPDRADGTSGYDAPAPVESSPCSVRNSRGSPSHFCGKRNTAVTAVQNGESTMCALCHRCFRTPAIEFRY